MYGWRARVGVLLPTNNTVLEPEMAHLNPKGVTFHATRMISSRSGHGSVKGLKNLVTNVDRAVEELSITGVNAIAYGCLSTSFVIENWQKKLEQKVSRWTTVPTITAFSATVNALKSFGAKKVAILCPYGPELQKAAIPAFNKEGLKVSTLTSLEATGLQAVCNVPLDKVYRSAKSMDLTKADSLCILATDLPALEMVLPLEEDLGIPVVSTNLALFWASMALCGINTSMNNKGSLLNNKYPEAQQGEKNYG